MVGNKAKHFTEKKTYNPNGTIHTST